MYTRREPFLYFFSIKFLESLPIHNHFGLLLVHTRHIKVGPGLHP